MTMILRVHTFHCVFSAHIKHRCNYIVTFLMWVWVVYMKYARNVNMEKDQTFSVFIMDFIDLVGQRGVFSETLFTHQLVINMIPPESKKSQIIQE